MILSTISAESADRLTEVRENINYITSITPAPPVAIPRHINSLKGMVFVQLYGVIEFTISGTIKESISYINNTNLKLEDIKRSIWSLVLNNELNSLITTNSKKWDKRLILTTEISKNIDCQISNDIMPTDGKNFGYRQVESVWKTFSITDPVLHDNAFGGRLSEIIDFRNKIAHGVTSPSDIGNRVTSSDLQIRQTEVSTFCSYIISVFEDYLLNQKFKN